MSSIRIIIREIRRAYDIRRRNREIVRSMSVYLRSGVYMCSPSGDSIYSVSSEDIIKETYSSYKKIPSISKGIIKFMDFFFRYKIKSNSDNSFAGTQLIISSSQKECKVFNFNNKQVLTKYLSLEKLLKYNQDKEIFSQSFNVPNTISINKSESTIIEQLITHQSYDTEIVLKTLARSISNFALSVKSTLNNDKSDYIEKCNFFSSRFGNCTFDDEAGQICILTHGDLWASNIISTGRDIYITDFERVGIRYFLYDFFTYIFTEWLLNNNNSLLHNYLLGEYDYLLVEIFKSVGVVFSSDKKEKYLLSFLVYYTDERWRIPSANDERVKDFLRLFIPSLIIS